MKKPKEIKKVAIRYSQHTDPERVGHIATVLNPGPTYLYRMKQDLNTFFTDEKLPYYANIHVETA